MTKSRSSSNGSTGNGVKPIFAAYCTTCHYSGSVIDIDLMNPFDPQANVNGGVHYLRDLLHRYHGNVSYALAAYNAGPGQVDAVHGIPAIAETRSYVARITAALR